MLEGTVGYHTVVPNGSILRVMFSTAVLSKVRLEATDILSVRSDGRVRRFAATRFDFLNCCNHCRRFID